jgi:hypothetical protein
MLAVPLAVESRNVEVQDAVAPEPERVHVFVVKLPATPVSANATVPAGVMAVPADEVSLTVAVQVESWLTTTGVVQTRLVDVLLGLTVMMLLPELGE